MLISQSASASGASIVTARSSDNGTTWQSLGTVVNGIASTTQGNDKEMMAIDNTTGQTFSHPGRIYVIWDAANAEKIAYSDDGAAWTTVNFPSNTGAIGGNVVIGADGTVYVRSGRGTTLRTSSFQNRPTAVPRGAHLRSSPRLHCNRSAPTIFRRHKTNAVSTASGR